MYRIDTKVRYSECGEDGKIKLDGCGGIFEVEVYM